MMYDFQLDQWYSTVDIVTFSITKYFLPSVQDNVNIRMTMINTSQPQHFS